MTLRKLLVGQTRYEMASGLLLLLTESHKDFLLDPYTYNYLNSTFQRKHETPKSYEGHYVTDVLADKAYGLLHDGVYAANKRPFFLTIAPIAPHGNIDMSGSILDENPIFKHDVPISAKRHQHLFKNLRVPRTVNFNPDEVRQRSFSERLSH